MIVVAVPMNLPKSSGSPVSSAPVADKSSTPASSSGDPVSSAPVAIKSSGSADEREPPDWAGSADERETPAEKKRYPLADALFRGIGDQLDAGEAERQLFKDLADHLWTGNFTATI